MVVKIPYKLLSFLLAVVSVTALCFYSEHRSVTTASTAQEGIPVPIIMYHHISERAKSLGTYVISPQEFDNDIHWLKAQGYTTISGQQLLDYVEKGTALPEKPIIITFDDGYESTYQYAYPILQKYGCKGIVSIVGRFTDFYSGTVQKDINYSHMNWEQVKELSKGNTMEIGNHTYDLHESSGKRKGCRIKKGESEEDYHAALADDIGLLQDKINSMTGKKPFLFAYPFGFYCKESVPILKGMGIKITFGCEEGTAYVSGADSLWNMKRYNRVHGVSSEAFFQKLGR